MPSWSNQRAKALLLQATEKRIILCSACCTKSFIDVPFESVDGRTEYVAGENISLHQWPFDCFGGSMHALSGQSKSMPSAGAPWVQPWTCELPWDNTSMQVTTLFRTSKPKAILIACLVILLALFTWIIPPHAEWLHNILHHLNILPFMLAGLFFGWRAALKTLLLAAVLQSPSIYRHWHKAPTDAQDQIVELSTFGAAGIIAGILADRERTLRLRVEATKQELETVHTELQQNIEQLRKTERLTAAGQLSASLAHEIRNPLASISGAAGILSRGQATHQSQRECLEILTKESQRLNKLLTNFLVFARPRLPRLQPVNVNNLLQSVTSLAQHAAADRNITFQLHLHAALTEITCDPEQVRQLLLNLLLNAVQASAENSAVMIATHQHDDSLAIEVRDEGEGIAAKDMEHIFDPFFTTKPNGTGLGLAIAGTIASQHGGSLTCDPNSPRGACFTLRLPLEESRTPISKKLVAQ